MKFWTTNRKPLCDWPLKLCANFILSKSYSIWLEMQQPGMEWKFTAKYSLVKFRNTNASIKMVITKVAPVISAGSQPSKNVQERNKKEICRALVPCTDALSTEFSPADVLHQVYCAKIHTDRWRGLWISVLVKFLLFPYERQVCLHNCAAVDCSVGCRQWVVTLNET